MSTFYFVLAMIDVWLGALNILVENHGIGIIFLICAAMLSLGIKDK